jgi:cytochrome c biogenesis protein CcmG, thiol:disulfide interchange protein DsbE
MVQNSSKESIQHRRGAPIWIQMSIWVVLAGILVMLLLGLFHAQHPILRVGSKVSDFTLTLFDDYTYGAVKQVKLSELRGKVVVVNFWASWCTTCADEAVFVEEAWKHYESTNNVVFLGVDYTDVDSKALAYLDQFGITYPNGPDLGTRITPIFNRNIAMPETYIIDQRGILRHQQIGPFLSTGEIQSILDPLINGN